MPSLGVIFPGRSLKCTGVILVLTSSVGWSNFSSGLVRKLVSLGKNGFIVEPAPCVVSSDMGFLDGLCEPSFESSLLEAWLDVGKALGLAILIGDGTSKDDFGNLSSFK